MGVRSRERSAGSLSSVGSDGGTVSSRKAQLASGPVLAAASVEWTENA